MTEVLSVANGGIASAVIPAHAGNAGEVIDDEGATVGEADVVTGAVVATVAGTVDSAAVSVVLEDDAATGESVGNTAAPSPPHAINSIAMTAIPPSPLRTIHLRE